MKLSLTWTDHDYFQEIKISFNRDELAVSVVRANAGFVKFDCVLLTLCQIYKSFYRKEIYTSGKQYCNIIVSGVELTSISI